MAYKITHIKTKGDDSFEFYDKGAIRGIKSSYTEESSIDDNGYYVKDDNGYITIKKTTYSAATENTLGLVSVPSLIDNDEETYYNDLKLDNGKLIFKDKIKKIWLGGTSSGNVAINNDTAIIPKMTTTKLGVAKVNSNQSVKIDNDGYLYTQFTGGWTDITKEETEIDFNSLISEGLLSLGEY